MALLSPGVITEIAVVLAVALGAVYIYFRRCYRYWDERNVKHTDPSFPFGDFQGIGTKRSMPQIITDIYNAFRGEKVVGYWSFMKPFLLVRDPEIIKNILVKDFSNFHDRGFELDTDLEPLANHLFSMNGQEWRNLRIKLAPTFTSGKMKMMFPTMTSVGIQLQKVLEKDSGPGGATMEVKDYMARYTTDVIGTCAFGLDVNSLKNPESEFRVISKQILKPSLKQVLVQALVFTVPKFVKFMKMRLIPKQVTDFFLGAVRDTIATREKNNIHRNDFMQLLIQLKNKGYIEDADAVKNGDKTADTQGPLQKFTTEIAAAQAFIFFFAGFETSSTTMQFALYELALQPDIQKKLQKEIDETLAKSGGELTYEHLQEMEYLDKVVSETLRKYPVAPMLMRQCNKEYTMPGTDIVIKKDDNVIIPVGGLHRDPIYYPNPDKFDPERFSPEEKEKRDHYVYIPFGEGPRICIGNRFALLQTKVGLVMVLSKFLVEVCAKTPIPIKFDPKLDLITVKGGMWLNVRKRNQN